MPKIDRIAAMAAVTFAILAVLPSGAARAADGASWSYAGPRGPGNWGSLSPGYRVCAEGRMQSPVDIAGAFPARGPALVFDYRPSPSKVVDTGHTIRVTPAPGSRLRVAGKVYALLQFHFHAPSEHAVAGSRAPMEAHFVHRGAAGTLAVVGVIVREGARNGTLARVLSEVQAGTGAAIDPSALLPPDLGAYFHYRGSLTTTPCSEGVRWFVLARASTASRDQIDAFRRVAGPNARPLQALNDRLLVESP